MGSIKKLVVYYKPCGGSLWYSGLYLFSDLVMGRGDIAERRFPGDSGLLSRADVDTEADDDYGIRSTPEGIDEDMDSRSPVPERRF